MPESFHPRLSEASALLPLLRTHLAAAAPRYTLPAGLALDLAPIVERGLFGYEIVPDRQTLTFLTIGCTATGAIVLRRTSYSARTSGAPHLAAVDGRVVSSSGIGARTRFPDRADARGEGNDGRRGAPPFLPRQCSTVYAGWPEAVDAAWAELSLQFPHPPRACAAPAWGAHRFLDQALAVAHSHLSRWDPFILFFGVPNEAQQGFQLQGADGARGTLISRRPDMWVLRWKSREATLCEEWAIALPDHGTSGALAQA
jgi:hypothetical protein